MARLEVLEHGVVYQNPRPNLVSEYVAFPAVQVLADGSAVCMCRHGSARESDDGVVRIHRSDDGGRTWSTAGALPEPDAVGVGMRLPGGFAVTTEDELLAWVCYPPAAGGSGAFVARSTDGGCSWSEDLTAIDTSPWGRLGPGGNLAVLPDGALLAAAEHGQETDGGGLPAWSSLLCRSVDGGRNWEPWETVHTERTAPPKYFFDLRLTVGTDGSLLAVYWTHDVANEVGLNVHTSLSQDAGRTWSVPEDAGFWGQVTSVCGLASGRVVAVTNHRRAPLGVRAVLSEDGGRCFDESDHVELWGFEPARVRNAPVQTRRRDTVADALDAYHHFTFGTPSVTQLPDGTLLAVFYVTEEHVTYVRSCRLREVEGS